MQLGQKIRYWFLGSLWIALTIGMSIRLVYLASYQRKFLMGQSKARVERRLTINAKRGKILDRNGEILAMSKPAFDLWAVPKALLSDTTAQDVVCQVLGFSRQQLQEKLRKNQHRDFYFLARNIDSLRAEKFKHAGLNNVYATPTFSRFYPGGKASAQLVGIIDTDGRGIEGIEYAFDSTLAGKDGYTEFVINPFGEQVESIAREESIAGQDVTLTIDRSIQYLTYEALKDGVKQTGAKSAHGVILDVKSGEIVAAASYPSFNPDDLNETKGNEQVMRQRTFTDLYEPGSTFKAITMAYILEQIPNAHTQYIDTAPGVMKIGNSTIRDVRNYGVLTVNDVLVKSSNVAIAKLLLQKPDGFIDWLGKRFQMPKKADIPFPGVPKSVILKKDKPSPFELATLSFGYGLSMSSVQLAQLYLTIANGGYWQPIKLIRDHEGPTSPLRRIMRAETVESIRTMLHEATKQAGTAWRARVGGMEVAGKTGTTHVYENGKYWENRHIASFAGFAPLHSPQYVLVINVEEPDHKYRYGGQAAAPIFSKIVFNSQFIAQDDR